MGGLGPAGYNIHGGPVQARAPVEVRCAADPAAGRAHVTVADTGPGVVAHERARIFEPLVSADRHPSHESQPGVGLGLTTSRDLARAMDGELTATSALDEGSPRTVTRPLAGRPTATAWRHAGQKGSPGCPAGTKVAFRRAPTFPLVRARSDRPWP